MSADVLRRTVASRGCAVGLLVLFIFAARAWLIRDNGSLVPIWDQWDAEAATLYPRWLDGSLGWRDLFAAHNEHRIALTRLADLALFVACGGWNPWAQLLFNAALHAATAGLLAALFWPAQTGRERAWSLAVIAVIFASTAGWQNALWGFQSPVYFNNLLAVLAFAGLTHGQPLDRAWWLGWLASPLSLFSNAGGILIAGSALGLGCLAALRQPGVRAWLAASASAAIVALGLALLESPPHHAGLRARDAGEFTAAFLRCLSWPHVNEPWPALLMSAPLVVLLIVRRNESRPLDPPARLAVALALFVLLHAAATAYSRGAGLIEHRPLSRYQDPLFLGVIAQAFAAGLLARHHGRRGRWLLLAWCGALLVGLTSLVATNLTLHLPYKRTQDAASLQLIREYAATRSPEVFRRDPRFPGPHPVASAVMRVIDDPQFRRVLPPQLLTPADSHGGQPLVVRHALLLTALAGLLLAAAIAAQATRSLPAR